MLTPKYYLRYFMCILGLLLLLALCALASERSEAKKHSYRFTYISPQRGLFQCNNGQKPSVQFLDNVMVLECVE